MIKALSEPKPIIGINKKKLEETGKDFYELRHKFSKNEVDKYWKTFYDIKNYRHLSTSEIEEARKNLIELWKSLRFKKFHGDTDSVDYDDLDNYNDSMILPTMMNIEKLEALEDYLKSLTEIITNQ